MAYGSKYRSPGCPVFSRVPERRQVASDLQRSHLHLSFFTQIARLDLPWELLELRPAAVVKLLFLWQPVTYMFLHAGFGHIIWNMLALWMFGADIETAWGTRRFLQFYFFCGIGAGLVRHRC